METCLSETMDFVLRFVIYGKALTQGSKRSMPIYRKGPNGKPVPVTDANGRVMTRTVNANPKLVDWRQQITSAAAEAFPQCALLMSPLVLKATFEIARPMGHYGTGKNEGTVKASSPKYHTQKPDVLKLMRAVEDSLTGVVYHDDSQIVSSIPEKIWGDQHKTTVTVYRL